MNEPIAESSHQPDAAHPRHILVPVDFSKPCLHGVAAAVDLAQRYQAKLTFVHVIRSLPNGGNPVLDAIGVEQDWEAMGREQLADFVKSHVPDSIAVDQQVAVGRPFHEVVRVACELACDLIVIATHGHSGVAHVLIGSNAERIVRHAPCPVLVVRGRPVEGSSLVLEGFNPRWVLLPTDFSENSRRAFPVAVALARQFGVRVLLVHVVAPVMMPGEIPYPDLEADRRATRANAERLLHDIRIRHLDVGVQVKTMVLEGFVNQVLCEVAAEDGPGLIVMATHGHAGWKQALVGTTTERVVRHAPCPVLVVR